MITLGIETSCDETSICILQNETILSLKTYTQVDLHTVYGGVVPEIASRDHLAKIHSVLMTCMVESGIEFAEIDIIAYTSTPGLAGSLLTGIMYARGLGLSLCIPCVPVNHIHGHMFTCGLTDGVVCNFLCLLLSGGHTGIYKVSGVDEIETLGSTIDDGVGEVFDKLSRAMGFGYPGGAVVESLAEYGDGDVYKFSIPLLGRDGCDFSMSGLKTQFLKATQSVLGGESLEYDNVICILNTGSGSVPHGTCKALADICASFQVTIVNIILNRLSRAMSTCSLRDLVVCGGVASNSFIRCKLSDFAVENGLNLYIPDPHLCTDNAAMIAYLGCLRYVSGNS
ncbi:MAG: N6-L-threonylcarbamoyladenine synthase [Candidatus Deianiraeaceae bacterium]|jgi:N6-L-threonylcarbamoyladenine synthase